MEKCKEQTQSNAKSSKSEESNYDKLMRRAKIRSKEARVVRREE